MGLLRSIEHYTPADFDTLGITEEQFELVASPIPWQRPQLNIVMRTMTSILFGTLEVMGVPKIVVPSEFVAAHIVATVHPANRMLACIWMAQERQTGVGALELAARQNTASNYDPTSADSLFALVCQLSDTDRANQARDNLRQKLGLRIQQAQQGSIQ